jgi:small conductance mechanosensitive channel
MQSKLAERVERLGQVMSEHGIELIQALFILVVGLLLIQFTMKKLKLFLDKKMQDRAKSATIQYVVYILLLVMIVTVTMVEAGFDSRNVLRLLIVISLVSVAIIILFRPYIPTLPFKVGNTVKVGGLLGKIEATTMIHTRMRTFDGKTVFIPNSKIVNDYVINYHYTPTRRVKLNFPIRNFEDMMPVKQLLEQIMIEDPRVLQKPARPVVYILNADTGFVEVGARCWVDNTKFWLARCDLLEKMLIRLHQEGIELAYRRKVIQLLNGIPEDPVAELEAAPGPHVSDVENI